MSHPRLFQSYKAARITANGNSDPFQVALQPKTFMALLVGGTGGNIKLQVSPDGETGWTDFTATPLAVSQGTPLDVLRSDDTILWFRTVTDSLTAGDIVDLYVSGVA